MLELRHYDLALRGLRVHCAEVGSGPPLLLLHGFLVSHKEWLAVLPHLASNFRCLLVDLPAFGQSERPHPATFAYTREAYANLLLDYLDELELTEVHLCGHSAGGGVAMTLASMQPERVARMTLVDSIGYSFPLSLRSRVPLLPVVGSFIFKKLYGRTMFRQYFKHEVYNDRMVNLDLVDAYFDDLAAEGGKDAAYEFLLRAVVDLSSLVDRIAKIQAPTMVVWGEQDRLIPSFVGRRLAQEIPNAALQLLPGIGHAPNEECPKQLAELLTTHHQAANARQQAG